jgi:hypothetical protein
METKTTEGKSLAFTEDQIKSYIATAVAESILLKTNNPKPHLTSKEAGVYLGKTANALRIMATRGQINFTKAGDRFYFLEKDLHNYASKGYTNLDKEVA